MSYYFDQNWYVVTHTSGRRRMFRVKEETHEGWLGFDWDIENERVATSTRFIPRSSVEMMEEIPSAGVHSTAIEVRQISRSRRGTKPGAVAEPQEE